MQRQVLVILQKRFTFQDMNNEDKRVYKILKNAFDYYAYSKIVVHFQFIYFKSIECFKRKWIWTHIVIVPSTDGSSSYRSCMQIFFSV